MVQFNPNVFLEGARREERQGARTQNEIQNIANMLMKQDMLKQAQAEKQRKEAVKREQDPSNIYVTASQGGAITPEQRARYEFERAKSGKVFIDEYGNRQMVGQLPQMGGQQPQGLAMPIEERGAVAAPMAGGYEGLELFDTTGLSPKGIIEVEKQGIQEQFKQREAEFNKAKAKPKMDRAFSFAKQSFKNLDTTIDSAIEDAGSLSAGFLGSMTDWIGGSPAANLKSTLQTIQADAAFDTLQQMRDNSPTGGALGAISEKELALLQNAKVALNQSQSPSQLKENLDKYRKVRKQALSNVSKAYYDDYGEYPSGFDKPKDGVKMDSEVIDYMEYFK